MESQLLSEESTGTINSYLADQDIDGPEGQPVRVLTDDQIPLLLELRYIDGNSIFRLEDKMLIYEVVGMIMQLGFEETYRYLSSRPWRTAKEIVRENPLLKKYRDAVRRNLLLAKYKPRLTETLNPCKKCGGPTLSDTRQTRGGDEGSSVIIQCLACNIVWKE